MRNERPKEEDIPTNFSLETLDSAYHALEGFDSLLGILTRVVSVFCKIIRDCLYGP